MENPVCSFRRGWDRARTRQPTRGAAFLCDPLTGGQIKFTTFRRGRAASPIPERLAPLLDEVGVP